VAEPPVYEEPPTAEEPPAPEEPITPGEPAGPDEQSLLQSFIDELTAAFGTAVDEFISALNATSVLPPLSQPSGNGVAYQKFLAIYNDMLGLVGGEAPEEPPLLDAIT
jgi:hypothetical protein